MYKLFYFCVFPIDFEQWPLYFSQSLCTYRFCVKSIFWIFDRIIFGWMSFPGTRWYAVTVPPPPRNSSTRSEKGWEPLQHINIRCIFHKSFTACHEFRARTCRYLTDDAMHAYKLWFVQAELVMKARLKNARTAPGIYISLQWNTWSEPWTDTSTTIQTALDRWSPKRQEGLVAWYDKGTRWMALAQV